MTKQELREQIEKSFTTKIKDDESFQDYFARINVSGGIDLKSQTDTLAVVLDFIETLVELDSGGFSYDLEKSKVIKEAAESTDETETIEFTDRGGNKRTKTVKKRKKK